MYIEIAPEKYDKLPRKQRWKRVFNFGFPVGLENWSHKVDPTMTEDFLGSYATPTARITGFAKQTYEMTLVFPSRNRLEARRHYERAQEIKGLLAPTLEQIKDEDPGRVFLTVLSFVTHKYCQLMSVSEEIDTEMGYVRSSRRVGLSGEELANKKKKKGGKLKDKDKFKWTGNVYPKLFRLTLSFKELISPDAGPAATAQDKRIIPKTSADPGQKPVDKAPSKTVAGSTKKARDKKKLKGKCVPSGLGVNPMIMTAGGHVPNPNYKKC